MQPRPKSKPARKGRRLNQPFRAPPAKPAPTLRVKLAELHIHPLLAARPTMASVVEKHREWAKTKKGSTRADAIERLAECEPRWNALVANVKKRGIVEALVIKARKEGGWWLLDGRNRTAAGKEAALKDAPARITAEDAEAVILGSLAARRHVSKELIAFEALHCYPHLLLNGPGRKTKEMPDHPAFATMQELADSIGVHRDTLTEAARVHRKFIEAPDLRADWETRFNAGVSFGGFWKFLGADDSAPESGNGTVKEKYADRFHVKVLTLAGYVGKTAPELKPFTEAEKAALKFSVQSMFVTMPDWWQAEALYAAKHADDVKARMEKLRGTAGKKGAAKP